MSRHAQVAFAAATALLAGRSILYSCTTAKVETATPESKRAINAHAEQMLNDGREIFRFDTLGSEAFWVKTRLHDAIAGDLRIGADVDQGRPGTHCLQRLSRIEPGHAAPCICQQLIDRGPCHGAHPR